jgi:hypothetical protein
MIWKIYARQSFDTDDSKDFAAECYQAGVIAVGWNPIGDLNAIPSQEQLFQKLNHKCGHWANHGEDSVRQWAGALWSFHSDVKKGHLVICPDRDSGTFYIGEILSEWSYFDKSPMGGKCRFAHRRRVKWIRMINRAAMDRIFVNSQFGGRQTVSRIHDPGGIEKLQKLLKTKKRSFSQSPGLTIQPDKEWGTQAERRAMVWLCEQGYRPVNEADQNKGWDIACGDYKFEIKGRKSDRTAIRLTQNEWRAAKQHKKRYTVLIFTAATKDELKTAKPIQIPDPTSNPELWKERIVSEYILVQ